MVPTAKHEEAEAGEGLESRGKRLGASPPNFLLLAGSDDVGFSMRLRTTPAATRRRWVAGECGQVWLDLSRLDVVADFSALLIFPSLITSSQTRESIPDLKPHRLSGTGHGNMLLDSTSRMPQHLRLFRRVEKQPWQGENHWDTVPDPCATSSLP